MSCSEHVILRLDEDRTTDGAHQRDVYRFGDAVSVPQVELTRRGSDGSDTLTTDWTLLMCEVSFT